MKRILTVIFFAGIFPAFVFGGTNPASESNQLYLRAMVEDSNGNAAGAQALLEQALALTPESAYLEKTAADLSFRRSDFENAAIHIEKSLALDNKNVKAYILAGQIYWGLGNQQKAESHFAQALKLAPDESEALVNLALSVTPKDPKRAIQLYNDYLVRHPDELEIQERLAQLYSTLGDLPKAKASWAKVLEISPESVRGHLASAQLAEVEHDTTTAITHYEAVLEQDSTNLPLLLRVGELRYRSDQMAQAHDAFSRAQKIAPNSASANFWLALLSENRGDWDSAIRYLQSVADKAPEPGVLLRLSYYYTQSGRQKDAIGVLKKLSDSDPENTDFMRYLSVAYDQDGQFAKAVEVVQRLIEIDPTNADSYFRLGTLYDRMNKFVLAEPALKKAIDLDPEFHMAFNYLGYSFAERNVNLDEADKLVTQALVLDPENGAYLDSMGWICFRQKKFKQAETFLSQAAKIGTDPLIWDHLGDAQMENKKTLEASLSYATSLRMDPKQKKLSSKLNKILERLPEAEKARYLLSAHLEDLTSIGGFKGRARVEACRGSFCSDVQSDVRFDPSGDLKFEIAGPMSVPFFLVVVSTNGQCSVGVLDPAFEESKDLIRSSMLMLDSIWRGHLFATALKESGAVQKVGSVIQIKTTKGDLHFDWPAKQLKFVEKDGKKMRFLKGSTTGGPFFPQAYEYVDPAVKAVFRLTLINPLTGTARTRLLQIK